jgi:hypothetical protein
MWWLPEEATAVITPRCTNFRVFHKQTKVVNAPEDQVVYLVARYAHGSRRLGRRDRQGRGPGPGPGGSSSRCCRSCCGRGCRCFVAAGVRRRLSPRAVRSGVDPPLAVARAVVHVFAILHRAFRTDNSGIIPFGGGNRRSRCRTMDLVRHGGGRERRGSSFQGSTKVPAGRDCYLVKKESPFVQ